MYCWDVMLSIAGCNLEENSAKEGGAIYTKGSLVKASNSVFTKNTADTSSGPGTAVQNNGNDYNSITFIYCTFVQDSGKGCMFNLLPTDALEVPAKYTSVGLHNCNYTSTSPAACLGTGTAGLRSKVLFDGSSTGFDSTIGTDVSLDTCHTSTGFEWLHTERKVSCICRAG
jgi:predicted outer membrane repeat protein